MKNYSVGNYLPQTRVMKNIKINKKSKIFESGSIKNNMVPETWQQMQNLNLSPVHSAKLHSYLYSSLDENPNY